MSAVTIIIPHYIEFRKYFFKNFIKILKNIIYMAKSNQNCNILLIFLSNCGIMIMEIFCL